MSLAADHIVAELLRQPGALNERAHVEEELAQLRGARSLEAYFAHLLEAPLDELKQEVGAWVDGLRPSAVAGRLSDFIGLLDLAAECTDGDAQHRLRRLAEVAVRLSQKYPVKQMRRASAVKRSR